MWACGAKIWVPAKCESSALLLLRLRHYFSYYFVTYVFINLGPRHEHLVTHDILIDPMMCSSVGP